MSSPFPKSFKPIEPQFPSSFKPIEKKEKKPSAAEKAARIGMQAAIGEGKTAAYLSPAGVPLAISELAIPGAIQQSLGEEIASEREMPQRIREAIGFKSKVGESEINPEIAQQASKELLDKITGGEGVVGGLVAAPFRAAGIETKPQGGWEEATRTVSELRSLLQDLSPALFTSLKRVPVKKTSGMTERKFESLERETPVSSDTIKKAKEGIEKDFKDITSNILRRSNKSYSVMQEDPEFVGKIEGLFDKVRSSAEKLDEPFIPSNLFRSLTKDYREIGSKGLTLSSEERVTKKELAKLLKDLRGKSATAEELLDQYRKNNKSLGKLAPFGEKATENAGKLEALNAYQKAIVDTIESNFGNTEFGQLFNFTNKRWNEIKKTETINKYVDALVGKDKIAFNQANKIFTDRKKSAFLKNAIGKDAFDDFKQLHKDLMSTEKSLKLLKKKELQLKDVPKKVIAYMIEPNLATLKFGYDYVRSLYRNTLSDPKKIRDWKKGLELMKKGMVKEGAALLNELPDASEM